MPLAAVSALRRNCKATYLSFSEASGSARIFATCSLCSRRSMNSTSWNACCESSVRASFDTLRIVFPSNSPVLTPSFVSRRYSVLSFPSWNIGAYLNSGVVAIMLFYVFAAVVSWPKRAASYLFIVVFGMCKVIHFFPNAPLYKPLFGVAAVSPVSRARL